MFFGFPLILLNICQFSPNCFVKGLASTANPDHATTENLANPMEIRRLRSLLNTFVILCEIRICLFLGCLVFRWLLSDFQKPSQGFLEPYVKRKDNARMSVKTDFGPTYLFILYFFGRPHHLAAPDPTLPHPTPLPVKGFKHI